MPSPSDTNIDSFLDSDESVDDLLREHFASDEIQKGYENIFESFRPTQDDPVEPLAKSSDGEFIKRVGIAYLETNTDDVMLDAELTPEEQLAAEHAPADGFADPMVNAITKATEDRRAERSGEQVSKRELLDLAAETVEDYFTETVKSDGIEEKDLARLKFLARKAMSKTLAKNPGAMSVASQMASGGGRGGGGGGDSDDKVYVSSPSEAPKGVQVHSGPSGGYYYLRSEARGGGGDSGVREQVMGAVQSLLNRRDSGALASADGE